MIRETFAQVRRQYDEAIERLSDEKDALKRQLRQEAGDLRRELEEHRRIVEQQLHEGKNPLVTDSDFSPASRLQSRAFAAERRLTVQKPGSVPNNGAH